MNKNTATWLVRQLMWHDQQVAILVSIALAVGFFLGWVS